MPNVAYMFMAATNSFNAEIPRLLNVLSGSLKALLSGSVRSDFLPSV